MTNEFIQLEDIEFEESFDVEGGIYFTYREPSKDNDGSYYEVHETIPLKIVKEGEEAIQNYALRKIKEVKKRWRKKEEVEDDIRKNHMPIQTKYKDGTTLEGRIVEATSRFIRVELDKPLQSQGHINFGFGSAMAGHYVFDGYEISEAGYGAARRALSWAYQDVLNKPIKDLVGRLNQRRK